jgi:serine/threonine-protein kinase RsbW
MTDPQLHNQTFPGTLSALKPVEDHIVALAQQAGYSEDLLFALRLSLDEALTNAVYHGNNNDPSLTVTIGYHISADRIDLHVADEGVGFDPSTVANPRDPENLEKPNGRGLMLIEAYMSHVAYNHTGNAVHMTLHREEP